MSVITSWPAIPNRIGIAWSYFRQFGAKGTNLEDFRSVFSPRALQASQAEDEEERSGTTISDSIWTEMRTLGLIQVTPDGAYVPSTEGPSDSEEELLRYLETRLLNPQEAELHGQSKFPHALAWFLGQDPATPLKWGSNYSEIVRQDCGQESESFELTNHSRFEQFIYWARYLGFAWRLEIGQENVVFPDPSGAMARHIPELFNDRNKRPLQEIMPAFAEKLFVLEGGSVRDEVDSMLAPDKQRGDGQLSKSTSFAFERLESIGMVRLNRDADAPPLILHGARGERPISHVTWINGE